MSTYSDWDVRRQIEHDLDENIIVEASAGTGKTECLARRIAALLVLKKAELQRVAVVTFTRKAAAELKGRLRLALERYLAHNDEPVRASAQEALLNLEHLFCGTIHSFCARLLRESPVEAGVSPGFKEIEPSERESLLADSLAWSLDRLQAEDPECLNTLIQAGIEQGDLLAAFQQLCDHPDVSFPVTSTDQPDWGQATHALFTFISSFSAVAPSQSQPESKCPLAIAWQKLVHRYRFFDPEQPATVLGCLELWETPPQARKKWWGPEFAQIVALSQSFSLQTVQPILGQWREYLYGQITGLLGKAREDFEHRRHRSGVLDYGDLLHLSAKLLRTNPAVRARLQSKYRWLFVDEFQDTDPLQAEVVCLLASDPNSSDSEWSTTALRPGALFVVGDPKQSIYRFRRADINVFNQVRDHVVKNGGKRLVLSDSFRSLPSLCEWFNTAFSSLFASPNQTEQATYSPLFATRQAEGGGLQGVYLLTDAEPSAKDLTQREAAKVAQIIDQLVQAGDHRWGDFLLLTVKRDDVSVYSRHLESRCIPVDVTGGVPDASLWKQVLLTLLTVLADPQDQVSTVGLLRGPLYGIDDETLYRHREQGGGLHLFSSAQGEEMVLGALADLRQMHQWTLTMPIGAAVEKILVHTGLLAIGSSADQGEGEAPALLQLISQLRAASLQGRPLALTLEQLDRADSPYPLSHNSGRKDVVRLMNLHQAKGLQARVVFLLAPTSGLSDRVTLRIARTGGLARGYFSLKRLNKVLAQPADWPIHHQEEQNLLRDEQLRLLYVAATRARDALVVGTWSGADRRFRRPWQPLEPFLEGVPELKSEERPAAAVPAPPLTLGQADQKAFELRALWADLAEPSWTRTSVTALRDRSPTPEASHTAPNADEVEESGSGTEWGDLIHYLLEQLVHRPDLEDEQLIRLAHWRLYDSPHLQEMVPRAVAQARRVTQGGAWAEITASPSRLSEVPFGAVSSSGKSQDLVFGVVDLAVEGEDGWQLVDYKTDRSALEHLTSTYRQQLEEYARQWSHLAGPVDTAKLYRIRSNQLSDNLLSPPPDSTK